jgi:hypothetical protein
MGLVHYWTNNYSNVLGFLKKKKKNKEVALLLAIPKST